MRIKRIAPPKSKLHAVVSDWTLPTVNRYTAMMELCSTGCTAELDPAAMPKAGTAPAVPSK